MLLLAVLGSASDECRISFKQWITDQPEDFNWGQCLQLFLDNSLQTLYPKHAKEIAASFQVSYVDKKTLNQTYFNNPDTKKCTVRVDSKATNIYTASSCTNCNSTKFFVMGRLNRIFLDLYATNNYLNELDVNLMNSAAFKSFLPSDNCGIRSLTLRQILNDEAPVSPTLFGNFISNTSSWKTPGVKRILKKCEPGQGGDSLMQESMKVAALMALGGFVDESAFMNVLKEEFDLYDILPKYIEKQSDFKEYEVETFPGGDIDGTELKRYIMEPNTPLPAYNGYISSSSLQNLLNLLLLDGFLFQNDGEPKSDGVSEEQMKICLPRPTRQINLEATRALFDLEQSSLNKDANAVQKELSFNEIDVEGIKFSVLHGARTGEFSGIAIYQTNDFAVAFSLLADISQDELFYEALAFIKSFFIEKSRDLNFHAAGLQLKGKKMISEEIPEIGFTEQFLKLFSRFEMDDLVLYKENLAAPKSNKAISLTFVVTDSELFTPQGTYYYDIETKAVSFFILCGLSVVCTILISIIGFFKKDENKATNLFDSLVIVPYDLRSKLSKRYRSEGFWFLFKKKAQKEEEGLEVSSDGEDFEAVAVQKTAGKKFKLSVNTCNIVNYYIELVKVLMLVLLITVSIVSLYITEKETNVMQIAFVGEKSWSNMIYGFGWVWMLLTLIEFADDFYVLGFNICSVTWTWIILELLEFCVDVSLVVYMSQMNLLTYVGGGSENW